MRVDNEFPRGNNRPVPGRRTGVRRGQTLVIVTIAIVAMFGMAGLAADVGSLYYGYQELQSATQAAALAGASALTNTGETASEAVSTATSYSALSGNSNARSNLTNVAMV